MVFRRLAILILLLPCACDPPVRDGSPVPTGQLGVSRQAMCPISGCTVNDTNDVTSTTSGCVGCGSGCSGPVPGSPCQYYRCVCNTCGTVNYGTTVACQDGNACTYGDHCDGAGNCAAGTPISCVGDACNSRTCNGTSSCTVTPINEGGFCNTTDKCQHPNICQSGTCVTEPAKVCPTQVCHSAPTCDPATGTCSSSPLSSGSCGGDLCSDPGMCTSGACSGTSLKDCSAKSDACNVGTCDPATGCVATPKMNGTDCSADRCHPGTCTNGACAITPIACGPCQTCDPASGACVAVTCDLCHSCNTEDNACEPAPGGSCSTGDSCKVNGVCNSSGVCDETGLPNGTSCSAACGVGQCVSGGCACGADLGTLPLDLGPGIGPGGCDFAPAGSPGATLLFFALLLGLLALRRRAAAKAQ